MLACGIAGRVRHRPEAGHRRYEDDLSVSLRDHARSEALRHRNTREHIDFEHRPQTFHRLFRNRPAFHETRIAEQHVDVMTEDMASIRRVGHVELLYLQRQALGAGFLF